MAKVLLLKLKTGEEILGKEVEDKETDNDFVISHARTVVAHPSPNGQMAVGFIPWMIGAPDKELTVAKSLIGAAPTDLSPTKELEDAYLQQTSGIAFATSANPGIQT